MAFHVFRFRHQGTLAFHDLAKNGDEKNKLASLQTSVLFVSNASPWNVRVPKDGCKVKQAIKVMVPFTFAGGLELS